MVIRWCPRCLIAESAELRLSKKKNELLNVVSRTSPFRSGDIAAFIIGRRVWGDNCYHAFWVQFLEYSDPYIQLRGPIQSQELCLSGMFPKP